MTARREAAKPKPAAATESKKPDAPKRPSARRSVARSTRDVARLGSSSPTVRADAALGLQRRVGNQRTQRAVADTGPRTPAPKAVHAALADRSPGTPLAGGARTEMEAAFGRNFANVRVHADGRAAELARGLKANAFTRGNDVYFAAGAYRPATTAGRQLIAHEVAHTLQPAAPSDAPALSHPNDAAEREAGAAASAVAAGQPMSVVPSATRPALARAVPGPIPAPAPTPTPTPTPTPEAEKDKTPFVKDPADTVALKAAVDTIVGALDWYTFESNSHTIVHIFERSSRAGRRAIMQELRTRAKDKKDTPEGMVEWLLGDLTAEDRQTLRVFLSEAQQLDPAAPGEKPREVVSFDVVNTTADEVLAALSEASTARTLTEVTIGVLAPISGAIGIGVVGSRVSRSARILRAFQEKSPDTIRAILVELNERGSKYGKPSDVTTIEWVLGAMIDEDSRELRNLLTKAAPADAVQNLTAKEVLDKLEYWTSEADSHEILALLTEFAPGPLDGVLTQLEKLTVKDDRFVARWLFGDLDRASAEKLRRHFLSGMGVKAEKYGMIYTADKLVALLDGYTSHADARSIIWNFENTPQDARENVLAELDTRYPGSTADVQLMKSLTESQYDELKNMKGLEGKLHDFDKKWEKGDETLVVLGFFEVISDLAEIIVGAILGIVFGIGSFLLGLLGIVVDIVKAVWYLDWAALYLLTGGAVGAGEYFEVKQFFKGLGTLFRHPWDMITTAWEMTTLESSTIEGRFEYGRRTEFWVRRVVTFVLNLYFIIKGAAAAAKGAAAFLAEAREAGLGAAFAKTGAQISEAGTKFLAGLEEAGGTAGKFLKAPITNLRALRPRLGKLLMSAADESIWKAIRRRAGGLIKDEVGYWQKWKDSWKTGAEAAQVKQGELIDKSENVARQLESDKPPDATQQAKIDEVTDGTKKLDEEVGRQEQTVFGEKEPGEPAVVEVAEAKKPPVTSLLYRGSSEEAVLARYIQEADAAAAEGVEVGVYRRRLASGEYEYAVVRGYKGGVSPPGEEWSNASHFHPGAAVEPGFHNPAPQDMSSALKEWMRNPEGPVLQKVHSRTATGELHEVEFGVGRQPDGKLGYFVRVPGEASPRWFKGLYPDEIDAAVKVANAIQNEAERLKALIEIFKGLDEDYYAGWWARHFSTAEGGELGKPPIVTSSGGGGGGGGGGTAAKVEPTDVAVEVKVGTGTSAEPVTIADPPPPDPAVIATTPDVAAERRARGAKMWDELNAKGKYTSPKTLPREKFIDAYEKGEAYNPETNRWYNAERSATPPKAPKVELEWTDEQVFDGLTKTVKPDGTKEYSPFFKLVIEQKIATPEEIEAAVKELKPRGKTVDYMRGNLKDKYRPEIIRRISDPDPVTMRNTYKTLPWEAPDGGKAALDQARYQEMVKYLGDLESSDKGNLLEEWYEKVRGAKLRHQRVTIEAMKEAGVDLKDLPEIDRVPDFMDGQIVQDLKGVEGPLSEESQAQFRTFTRLIGRNVKIGDSFVLVEGVRYTFPFPGGVRANAQWMINQLEFVPKIAFEVYSTTGETRIITAVNASQLQTPDFWKWLGVKAPQFVK